MCELVASGSGYGLVAGPCEHGNEPSDSKKKGREFFDWLSDY
jgi:hypothetical protein